MQRNKSHRVYAFLLGMLFCTTGCAANQDSSENESSAVTDLPPLVTTTEEEIETSETTELPVTTELAEPAFDADIFAWKMPDELGNLKTVRCYNGDIYLLGIQQEEEADQNKGILFRASAEADPEFVPLFPNADSANFSGLTDFDVLSDGTICGLLCENSAEVPYDDPNFNPDTFDWESYYENYATQYRLVWYNSVGAVTQRLGLSTLLDLDETARQTMSFTSIRCDSSDQIYLTATIDERDYLMALDKNGNLCPVQGASNYVVELESAYQWVRSGTNGMILWEVDAEENAELSHLVVTDSALWKTEIVQEDTMSPTDTMLIESTTADALYGIWNQTGLYRVSEKRAVPDLLYTWNNLRLNNDTVSNILFLSESCALLSAYDTQGNLSLELITPKEDETTTEPDVPQDTHASPSETTPPPVATPVNFS